MENVQARGVAIDTDGNFRCWQRRDLFVAQNSVGLFAFSGTNGDLNEWVELDYSGNVTRRMRLDQPEHASVAFTAHGHVYRKLNYRSSLQVLSRETSEWQDAGMATSGWLLGADGNSLVFSEGGDWSGQDAMVSSAFRARNICSGPDAF